MLHRFLEGMQSHDNDVLTAITVSLGLARAPSHCLTRVSLGSERRDTHGTYTVRARWDMFFDTPTNSRVRKYPFNIRSFFTDREKKDIGQGIELWRGYFQ